MITRRAVSTLVLRHVKESEGERVIEGICSTPSPDRMGDVVEPQGAQFTLPMPLLWQHQHDAPIGSVVYAAANDRAIGFKAKIAQVAEPGELKDRLDMAWQSITAGLVKGISIGFRVLKMVPLEDGPGMRFTAFEILEVSAVTVPANSDCSLAVVKSLDAAQRLAHLPKAHVVRLNRPIRSPGA